MDSMLTPEKGVNSVCKPRAAIGKKFFIERLGEMIDYEEV